MNSISLKGVIDLHVHTSPSFRDRLLDDIELAKEASAEEMKAIVIKSHTGSTVERAIIAKKVIPNIDIFGGICLNKWVGGLNPDAVRLSSDLGGKIVWMPTVSAANQPGNFGNISVLENGDIKHEVVEILEIASKNGLIIGTGHLSVEETLSLLEYSESYDIQFVANHPLINFINASIEEQKEMVKKGARLEHCYAMCMSKCNRLNPKRIAESILEIGAENCILATDLGQAHNVSPVEGFKEFIEKMLELDISEKAIQEMVIINPSKLLYK